MFVNGCVLFVCEQVLGSVDNVHKDTGSSQSSNLYTIGEVTGEKAIPVTVDGASSIPEKGQIFYS